MYKALTVVGILCIAPWARAQDVSSAPAPSNESQQIERPFEIQPSRHEMSVQLGYATGFGGDFGSPSGLKITGDYAYKFHRIAWFDLQLGNTFGFGSKDGRCVGSTDSNCYRGGWDVEIAAGVKLKFSTPRLPQLQIEVPILLGADVLYNRNCGDNGAAVVVRPGIRAKYFLTPRIGVGIGMNAAFGPAFHASGDPVCTTNSYTDFYGAFDFMAGAEFML
jgi:hypothetical protein